MKKLAFISAGYLPVPAVNGGAVETLIDMLLLSEELKKMYDIDVYSVYSSKAIEVAKCNGKVNYFYIKKSNKLFRTIRYIYNKYMPNYIGNDYIHKIVKNYHDSLEKYDVVIVENKPEFVQVLRKCVKGKIIFHSHNDFLNKNTKNAKKISSYYDAFFCLSKFILNRINEIDIKNKSKNFLLYNGVDIEKFQKIDKNKIKAIRAKYGIQDNDYVYLYSGRLVPEKGVKELITAFNMLNDTNIKLLIIGSVGYGRNSKSNYLHDLYELSKDNKKIIFTGYIDYAEISNYYHIANVGIIPSIWEEPFALTVIENLASGHPVIITDSGAMPEIVNNKCALIIKKNDIINNLYKALKLIREKNFKTDDCIHSSQLFSKDIYIENFIKNIEEGFNEN